MIFVSLISNSNPSGAPEVTPNFLSEVPVAQSLIFYVLFCRQSSFLFLLAIALSDYPFCIFKLVFTILFKELACLLPNTFSLLSISIFRPWAYMRKVIAVTRRVQYIIYLRFHSKLTQYLHYETFISNTQYVVFILQCNDKYFTKTICRRQGKYRSINSFCTTNIMIAGYILVCDVNNSLTYEHILTI